MTRSAKALFVGAIVCATLLLPEASRACSVCFGPEEEGTLSAGLNAGIAVLLGLVLVVQVLVVCFFVRAIRRSRRSAEAPATPAETSP
ncbi:MAG: hypothetical protein AAGA81_08020 [Acidobacteriota bacterium]